ncbi:MAG: hypothetical protein M1813_007933 [Trichoglossum hirsutum]|nr:MAG: hypothetical protein M1813_007933 [Trichoglossum hirsutum]
MAFAFAALSIGIAYAQSCNPLTPSNPSTFWLQNIHHNGAPAPAPLGDTTFPVWRNVKSSPWNAVGDGVKDDTNAIQTAINAGTSNKWRFDHDCPQTNTPALVYIPAGTYRITSSIKLLMNTILIGDPLHMPVLKADANLGTNAIIYAYDSRADSATTQFYKGIRNIIFDTTAVSTGTEANALNWPVSQACSLFNVNFRMPNNSGHIGIIMAGVTGSGEVQGGSGTIMGDLSFTGGATGIRLSNQQYLLKNITFNGCRTAIRVDGIFVGVLQGMHFQNGATGIDIKDNGDGTGSITLIDSTASFIGTVVNAKNSGHGAGSLVIENLSVSNSGPTVRQSNGGQTLASGSITDTWVMGNAYVTNGPSTGSPQTGSRYPSNRSPSLLGPGGNYFTMQQPQYENYDATQFVNVKDAGAKGDGVTDDTATLQGILTSAAGCKIVYFPQGTYIVTNTLYIPPGSRIVGDVWSAISASGSTFNSLSNPVVMLQVGKPGEVGIAQISDMLFTTADILPGAILLEVNMAGANPGDVGIWNTHFRIGGSLQTKVNTDCGSDDTGNCKAAFAMLHIKSSASAYIENMWGWTADHSIDGGASQNIATGRGALVESTKATWLVGTAFEHNTLYQYHFNNAQNIYVGMQQTETAYWQGGGSIQKAPNPWPVNPTFSDPDFSNCRGSSNDQCPMGWATLIAGGSNIFIYGSALWSFFNDNIHQNWHICSFNNPATDNTCQLNMAQILDPPPVNLRWYALNTLAATNMLLDGSGVQATRFFNPGSWQAVIAAYLRRAGEVVAAGTGLQEVFDEL